MLVTNSSSLALALSTVYQSTELIPQVKVTGALL